MYGLSRRELGFALVIGSAHFTQHVYYRVLPPLIPVLAVALDYPLWQLGLLISLYTLGMGIAQAPVGVLADRVDRIVLLPTGLALTGGGYVVFALAPVLGAPLPALTVLGYTFQGGYLVMSLAMVVVGLGLAVVHPVGYPMISENVGDANKGKVLGVFGAASKLGDGATPAAVAVLILVLAWQEIVLLIGVAGMLYSAALYWLLLDDDYETLPSGRRRVDARGDRTADRHGRDRRTYVYPMVVMYFFFIFVMLSGHAITTFLPAFLVDVYELSLEVGGLRIGAESVANVYFALVLVAGAVVQLYLGALTDTHDSRLVLLGCMALATLGMVALALFEFHPLGLLVVVVLLGAGLYGINPPRDALISEVSPPEHEGRSFGYIWTAATLSGAAFPALVGYVLEHVGMRQGYLVLAAGTAAAAVCIALLYSSRVYVAEAETSSSVETSD